MKLNVEKINFELRRLNWNQAILAEKSGMSRQLINYILKQEKATFTRLGQIAQALMVSEKDLLI